MAHIVFMDKEELIWKMPFETIQMMIRFDKWKQYKNGLTRVKNWWNRLKNGPNKANLCRFYWKFDITRTISILYRVFYCIGHLLFIVFILIKRNALYRLNDTDNLLIFIDKLSVFNLVRFYRRSLEQWQLCVTYIESIDSWMKMPW